MTIIGEAPARYGPTEAGNYRAVMTSFPAPQVKEFSDGTTQNQSQTIWRFDEFPDEEIYIYINVDSRGPRGKFDKLSRATTGNPVGYGKVDTAPMLNVPVEVVYGYGNNPRDPNALGVTGFNRIRQPRQLVAPRPAPQPQVFADDDEEAPF